MSKTYVEPYLGQLLDVEDVCRALFRTFVKAVCRAIVRTVVTCRSRMRSFS